MQFYARDSFKIYCPVDGSQEPAVVDRFLCSDGKVHQLFQGCNSNKNKQICPVCIHRVNQYLDDAYSQNRPTFSGLAQPWGIPDHPEDGSL